MDSILGTIEEITGILLNVEKNQGDILTEINEDKKIKYAYESSKKINEVLAILKYCIKKEITDIKIKTACNNAEQDKC